MNALFQHIEVKFELNPFFTSFSILLIIASLLGVIKSLVQKEEKFHWMALLILIITSLVFYFAPAKEVVVGDTIIPALLFVAMLGSLIVSLVPQENLEFWDSGY